MSSLQAACADNFYHPPDWDPRKQSRAEHATGANTKEEKWKAHPLRERAKKLATEGILTIRFEMPFNVRCTGCDNHIAMGVRFDAEKKTIGKYLSTKILSFRMHCKCEDGTSRTDRRHNPHFIEIHTDPKNAEYVIADGAVRVAEPSLLTPEELGVEATLDPDEAGKRAANPFYRLETGGGAKKKPWLTALQERREADWHDDYDANAALRRAHRARRHATIEHQAHAESRGVRVPVSLDDDERHASFDDAAAKAAHAGYASKKRKATVTLHEPRRALLHGSIFSAPPPTKRSSAAVPLAAAEAERLRLLRLRKERGMQIKPSVCAPEPPARTGAQALAAVEPVPKAEVVVPRGLGLVAYSDSE